MKIKPVILYTIIFAILIGIMPWFKGQQDIAARLLTSLILLMASILVCLQPEIKKISYKSKISLFAFGLLGWGALSLLWSVEKFQTVNWVIYWIILIGLFLIAFRVNSIKKVRYFVFVGYIAICIILAAYGLYQYITGHDGRLISFMGWPNPTAAYFIPAILLIIYKIIDLKKYKTIYWISVVFIFSALWLTQSRGATFILLFLLAVLTIFIKKKRRYLFKTGAIIVISFLLSLLITQVRVSVFHADSTTSTFDRVISSKNNSNKVDVSGSDRLNYSISAFKIWQDYPMQGSGAGTYKIMHPMYQIKVISASSDAHNIYMQTLSELGIVGFVLLALLIYELLLGLYRGLKHDPELIPWVLGFIGLLLHLAIDLDWQYPAVVLLAAVLAGLSWKSNDSKDSIGRANPIVPALLLVGVILLWSSFSSYESSLSARTEQDNGEYSAAVIDYDNAHQTLVYDPVTIEQESINLYELGTKGINSKENLGVALTLVKKAEAISPHSSYNYELEGKIMMAQKNLNGARSAFEKSLYYDPYNQPQYAGQLAQVLVFQNNRSLALSTINNMLNQYPNSVIANRNFLVQLRPSIRSLLLQQASLYLELGQKDKADKIVYRLNHL